MADSIGGLPYWELVFDADGRLRADDHLGAELAGHGLDELFVFCHGWNTSKASSRNLYHVMFGLLAGQLARHAPGRRAGLVGVFWPALVFPDDDPFTTAGDTSQVAAPHLSGRELAVALAPAFPDQHDTLADIGGLLDEQPADTTAFRRYAELIRSLVRSPTPSPEDAGEAALFTAPPEVAYGLLATLDPTRPTADRLADAAGPEALWFGARAALRVASYFEMKARAGVIGQAGLGPLLDRLVPATAGGPRVHLLGHSFGARLVAFALAGLPAARRGPASPMKSLLLIQGAFSHFSFAPGLPFAPSRSGALAGLNDRVDGPLIATFTTVDRALGWWYPLASMLAGSDAGLLGRLEYRWDAMGHDGFQQDNVTDHDLQPEPQPYTFAPHRFYRLNANHVIAADQNPFAGAHSDVRHPEVTWASVAAALAPAPGTRTPTASTRSQ